jgi:hypothetical protein
MCRSPYIRQHIVINLPIKASRTEYLKFLPFMLTASLVLGQRCLILVIAHKSILEPFALFGWGGDRRSSDNESLAFNTWQGLKCLDLCKEFLLHLIAHVRAELE